MTIFFCLIKHLSMKIKVKSQLYSQQKQHTNDAHRDTEQRQMYWQVQTFPFEVSRILTCKRNRAFSSLSGKIRTEKKKY